jgi:hypothetical protein
MAEVEENMTPAKASQDATLLCAYCLEGREDGDAPPGVPARAHVTVHDGRGCMHLCISHTKKRITYSFSFGHSPDCPYHGETRR